MYEAYWQLERRPFDTTSESDFYYPCESHQGALLKLRYTIENRRGTGLLTGASGIGKTLVVQLLKQQIADRYQPRVHLVYPQMPADELLAYIAEELTGSAPPTTSIKDSVRRIERALDENATKGRHAILVIDEAHLVKEHQAWEALRLLSNFQGETGPSITTILVGQPALLPLMDRMPHWEERLGVKCLLRPFTVEETMSYITHRLNAAGARAAIFDAAALEAVHYLTHGIARKINRLCDLALLIAYAEEQPMIGAAQVEAVVQELVTVAPE
jgi:general secretion pathway protein A